MKRQACRVLKKIVSSPSRYFYRLCGNGKSRQIAGTGGFGWSDVGSWDCRGGSRADDHNNSAIGANKVQFVGPCTHVETQVTEKVIAAIGVEVWSSSIPQTLLVADRSKSQEVKLVVEALKSNADAEYDRLPATFQKPSNTYATLKHEEGYQVSIAINARPARACNMPGAPADGTKKQLCRQ